MTERELARGRVVQVSGMWPRVEQKIRGLADAGKAHAAATEAVGFGVVLGELALRLRAVGDPQLDGELFGLACQMAERAIEMGVDLAPKDRPPELRN